MIYHALYYFDSLKDAKLTSVMYSSRLNGHFSVLHVPVNGSVHLHVLLDSSRPIQDITDFFNVGLLQPYCFDRVLGNICSMFEYCEHADVVGPVRVSGTLVKRYNDYLHHKSASNK